MVVQAITFIFKSLGLKCVPYLAQVMPAYIHVIKTSDATFREVLCLSLFFNQSILQQYILQGSTNVFIKLLFILQFLLQQLGVIIAIVKQHIRNYLDDIFSLVKVGCASHGHCPNLKDMVV